MNTKSEVPGDIFARGDSPVEIQVCMRKILGEGLSKNEVRRLKSLSFIVVKKLWEARRACSPLGYSKRSVGRLKEAYERIGLDCIWDRRSDDRSPFQVAKEQIRIHIFSHKPMPSSGGWHRFFVDQGIPTPSCRTLRQWIQKYRRMRRAGINYSRPAALNPWHSNKTPGQTHTNGDNADGLVDHDQ
jgi:hypothetical protein